MKPFGGGESVFGESAFLKNLDAFRMLSVDSPLSPNCLTCGPLSRIVGNQDRGSADAGWSERDVGRSKEAQATIAGTKGQMFRGAGQVEERQNALTTDWALPN